MKKNNFKIIIFYAVLIIGVFVALSFLFAKNEAEPIKYGQVVEYFDRDEVKTFVVDDEYKLILTVYLPSCK